MTVAVTVSTSVESLKVILPVYIPLILLHCWQGPGYAEYISHQRFIFWMATYKLRYKLNPIYLFDTNANQTNIYLLNLVNSNCHSCHMALVIVFYFSEYVCVHFTKHDKSKFLGYRCSHLRKFFESQS